MLHKYFFDSDESLQNELAEDVPLPGGSQEEVTSSVQQSEAKIEERPPVPEPEVQPEPQPQPDPSDDTSQSVPYVDVMSELTAKLSQIRPITPEPTPLTAQDDEGPGVIVNVASKVKKFNDRIGERKIVVNTQVFEAAKKLEKAAAKTETKVDEKPVKKIVKKVAKKNTDDNANAERTKAAEKDVSKPATSAVAESIKSATSVLASVSTPAASDTLRKVASSPKPDEDLDRIRKVHASQNFGYSRSSFECELVSRLSVNHL